MIARDNLLTMEHATPTRVSAFDPDAYLRELNKPSVSVDMLQAARNQVQTKVDETNASLKRNVYKNYALFIDTAKEISLLKNEMYTLSHLLTEEQQLLSNLTDISISGDKTHGLTLNEKREVAAKFRTINEEPSPVKTIPKSQSVQVISPSVTMASKELTAILDKIEGCSGMLETRNRILLNHGELTELDANDYSKIPNQGRTLVVLLNDCLILAQAFPFPSRMGKRFKFTSLYELDNVAVVNVKDMSVKNAFKILMFPSTKVYEVETIESKKRWIESFEMAKKQRRASLSLQRRDSLLYLSTNLSMDGLNSARDGTGTKSMMSPVDHRPGYTFEDVAELLEDNSESESEALPQWLQEVPEDMDVMMAQRDFEKAVELVHRVNDHLVLYPKCYDGFMQNDLKLRTNHKIQELVEFIANELQTTPDRSLQSGPRSARRAVQLLLRLGKSSMAVKLFLNQRSALLKFSLKQQITEGSGTVQYSKRICGVFGNNVIESCREFDKAFRTSTMEGRDRDSSFSSLDGERDSMNSNNDRTASSSYPVAYPLAALVGWTRSELKNFVNETFSKAVFPSTNSSSVIAECVAILRNHVNRIRTDLRLDMLFVLDTLLKADIDKLIKENSEKIIKDIKAWKKDEKWTPSDLGNCQ